MTKIYSFDRWSARLNNNHVTFVALISLHRVPIIWNSYYDIFHRVGCLTVRLIKTEMVLSILLLTTSTCQSFNWIFFFSHYLSLTAFSVKSVLILAI